ncbi:unnamed protein product [Moneuplotes crassus]|uniref:Uncharacterized protein n=1 Tax=Euplotes crassus TaxID=5936 RepID=A0AAD1UQY5_EUPCR|nr:unnamed protein product [Moneuplotes crassus]
MENTQIPQTESNSSFAAKHGGASVKFYCDEPFGLKRVGPTDSASTEVGEEAKGCSLEIIRMKTQMILKALASYNVCMNLGGEENDATKWIKQLSQIKEKTDDIEKEGNLDELEELDTQIQVIKEQVLEDSTFAKFRDNFFWSYFKQGIIEDGNREGLSSKSPNSLCSEAYTPFDFKGLYKAKTGATKTFGPTVQFKLELNKPKDMDMLLSLDKRMPELKTLQIAKIPEDHEESKTAISKYFPERVKEFHFNQQSPMGTTDFYSSALLPGASSVLERAYLWNLNISEPYVTALISAYKGVSQLFFGKCILNVESTLDFGDVMQDSQISILGFENCGDEEHGVWERDSSPFVNIMAGLGKTEAKTNLKKVRVKNCGMKNDQVRDILKSAGLGDLEIGLL